MRNLSPTKISKINLLGISSVLLFVILLGSQVLAQNYILDPGFTARASDAPAFGRVSAVQPDGKILVAGDFTFVDGAPSNGLTRLNSDGTVDSEFISGSGPTGEVYDIVLQSDGKILIGGDFSAYDGFPVARVARLEQNGTLDLTFNQGGSGVSGFASYIVRSIVIQIDGRILIAGDRLTGYNGVSGVGLFRLDANGGLDTSFVSGFSGTPLVNQILTQPDGRIVVVLNGGQSTYGGVPVGNLLRINPNATLDTAFNTATGTNASGGITSVALQSDGRILIGGTFSSFNGTSRSIFARINSDGSLDQTFVPSGFQSTDSAVFVELESNGQILATGQFGLISGYQLSLMRLDASGARDVTFAGLTDNYGSHVALQQDGKILLTGQFGQAAPDFARRSIVRYDPSGAVDPSFNASLTTDGAVTAIARQPDGKILVGGEFTSANGNPCNNLARFNDDGTFDNTFDAGLGPLRRTYFSPINSIKLQADGKILVGGQFNKFNGSDKRSLVRLNQDGSVDQSFTLSGPDFDISFYGLRDLAVLADGKLLVTGNTMRILPSNFNKPIARLNVDGSLDTTFSTTSLGNFISTDGYRVLVQPDGKILIVGFFQAIGASAKFAFRLNADGTTDASFIAVTGTSTIIDAFLQPDGKVVYAGQNFTRRLTSTGGFDMSFTSVSADNSVKGLVQQADGKILVGGAFSAIGGVPRSKIAQLNPDGPLTDIMFGPITNNAVFFYQGVDALMLDPEGSLYAAGGFSAYDGVPRTNLLRLIDGGIQTPSPTPTATATNTPTATPTNTPTATATPTPGPLSLGNYPAAAVDLSGNTTVAPDAGPTGAVSLSVVADTSFYGSLVINPVTGVVRITNAHPGSVLEPGGVYTITIRADGTKSSISRTFSLTVTNGSPCARMLFEPNGKGFAGTPLSPVVADFNKDGNQDLAVAGRGTPVGIYLGNGLGGFATPIYLE